MAILEQLEDLLAMYHQSGGIVHDRYKVYHEALNIFSISCLFCHQTPNVTHFVWPLQILTFTFIVSQNGWLS